MDDRPECRQISERIDALARHISRLREILETEPDLSGGTIQRMERDISESQTALNQLNQELVLCRSDLTVTGVEVTQAIQYFSINGQGSDYAPDNSVPLVALRPTILRVYTDCKRVSDPNPMEPQLFPIFVDGRVTVHRLEPNGTFRRLSTLSSINGPIGARASASIDRGDANHTLNFRVPAIECQGLLRFTVAIFEPGPVVDGQEATTFSSTGFSTRMYSRFYPVPTFRVHGVLVHYTGDGMNLAAPTGLDLAATLDYVVRTYPVARIEFEDCTEIDFGLNLRTPGGGCGPGFEGPGGLMEILRDFDEMSERAAIHVGLIPRQAVMSVGGCGNHNIAAARDGAGVTFAQEIGHALDRKHAPDAPGYDPNFPHYGNYPWGSIGEYGFDVWTSEVHDPNYVRDFMSYDWPKWISPFTFMALRNTIADRFGDDTARLSALRNSFALERQEQLFLSFRVHWDGKVDIKSGWQLPARPRQSDGSPYADVICELLDSSGEVLVSHRCRQRGPHDERSLPFADYREVIPWVDSADSIRFRRGSDVLHVHTIESSAPSLHLGKSAVRSAARGKTLSWRASHSQGNSIKYLVRYSVDDGEHWRVVGVAQDRPECRLDFKSLPGGEHCAIQVVASSGIRTSVAQTKRFMVPRKGRVASILGADVLADGRLRLRGGAFSPDFGLSDADDTTWTSNLDGHLGQGLNLITEGVLAAGMHEITVSAPSGDGGRASAIGYVEVPRLRS